MKIVVRCPEPQAGKGECGPESEIGESSVAVGAGANPYWVKGGKVYLTDAYGGGAFGLSIMVPTTAGPFTLAGNGGRGKEVVRASIGVDPHTAQITVTSDELPSMLEGVPLQIRMVNVTIDPVACPTMDPAPHEAGFASKTLSAHTFCNVEVREGSWIGSLTLTWAMFACPAPAATVTCNAASFFLLVFP